MKLKLFLLAVVFGFTPTSFSAGLSKQIGAVVADFVKRAEIDDETPGMAVLVTNSRTSKVIFQRYEGLANLGEKTPIDPSTPFRLGSVSKPMTAAAVQLLDEQSRLRVRNPAQRLLPVLSHENATIHHLLTHSAGFQEYTGFQFLKSKSTNSDILDYLEGKRLRFEPGTKRAYSNTGYAILASAIEAASDMSFADYMKQEVFEPLGMTSASVPGLAWKSVPKRAIGYNRILWQYLEDDEDFLNGIVGDGGVYCSAKDLDTWMTAYFGHRIISKPSVDQALQSQSIKEESFRYGYGWILERMAGQKLAWHNGCWVGFDTFVCRVIPKQTNIIILSNAGLDTRDLDVTKLGFSIAALLSRSGS